MENYTQDPQKVAELAAQGHVIEEGGDIFWYEVSCRKPLDECRKYRAHLTKKRELLNSDGSQKIFYGDTVIFKQKTARWLSVNSDKEFDYEDGHVIGYNEDTEMYTLLWLQGHSSRSDDVSREDIVSLFDPAAEYQSPKHLFFSGTMHILGEIVEPQALEEKKLNKESSSESAKEKSAKANIN